LTIQHSGKTVNESRQTLIGPRRL